MPNTFAPPGIEPGPFGTARRRYPLGYPTLHLNVSIAFQENERRADHWKPWCRDKSILYNWENTFSTGAELAGTRNKRSNTDFTCEVAVIQLSQLRIFGCVRLYRDVFGVQLPSVQLIQRFDVFMTKLERYCVEIILVLASNYFNNISQA